MNHDHRYYGYQVKADFEPLAPEYHDDMLDDDGNPYNVNKDLYRRTEYAVSICNCGAARKVKVVYEE